MQDLLKRAWDVLAVDERPEGMPLYLVDPCFYGSYPQIAKACEVVTYDRLTRAVEDVLLTKMSCAVEYDCGYYRWATPPKDGGTVCGSVDDKDRLAAAVIALESERSKA